jgi:tetratricopeptide (TPR) repeat protein
MSLLPLRKNLNLFNLIALIIISILFPAISLADADRIFKENSNAVVVIETYDKNGKPIGQGSGFIVRQDGAVVTNYHVISDAVDIKVRTGNKVLKVEGLLHIDKENDIVILKAKGEKLQTVKIGDIEKLSIGEKVYVISSPKGLENTISEGILSGIREIDPKRKIIQITAPVSEGSSGGPVFNKNGEVIGIATFLLKEAQNLNFAMPANLIKYKISATKVIALRDAEIEEYEKTAEYWFILGYYYGEAGLYKEAIEAYKQAIRIKPDLAVAHGLLGNAYGHLGLYKESIEAFKQAIRIEPDYAEAYCDLGVSYNELGMHKEAIEAYKQAIRIKPDLAEAHFGLGVSYGKLGMYREKIESFKQAIRIEPDYAEAHYNLGVAYYNSGMYKEAVEANKQAIRIKPDYAEAHYNLGVSYGKLGMHRKANEAFKQAIRIKPDFTKAHYNLGITYLIIKDRGSALDEYKILKNLDPESANELFNLIYK